MKQKIVVTVPKSRIEDPRFAGASLDLVRLCGGATSVEGSGIWFDPSGLEVIEPVYQMHFCVPFHVGYSTADDAMKAVVKALIDAGEQAVLVEFYRPGGYTFELYTKEHFA